MGYNLNERHRRFISRYVTNGLDSLDALKFAGYKNKDYRWQIMKDPEVRRCLRDILKDSEFDDKIVSGVRRRLDDPDSKNWQPTADYVAKIRGDFAAEKVVQVTLTAEERAKRYQEILDLVEAKDEVQPEGT